MPYNMKTDWFKDWFNTKHYHILYKDRDHTEAKNFIKNLVDRLEINKEASTLDLACGKGRHSIYLNSLGLDVTGVDLSEESILEAKKSENSTLHFDTHDMRETYKEYEFDYVLNLFTSFGYFEDDKENQMSIDAIHHNLKPDGKLVLDFMNTHKVLNNLVKEEIKRVDGIDFHIIRELDNNFINKKISFSDNGKEYHFEESVRALTKENFLNYFSKSGFKITGIFGDYSLSEFDIENSDRLIFVCEK